MFEKLNEAHRETHCRSALLWKAGRLLCRSGVDIEYSGSHAPGIYAFGSLWSAMDLLIFKQVIEIGAMTLGVDGTNPGALGYDDDPEQKIPYEGRGGISR